MNPTPPEFAAAGLDHTTQLYQLTRHVNRLRKTVNRLWACTGILVLVAGGAWIGILVPGAGVSTAYARLSGPQDLIGKSLVLEGSERNRYTIQPISNGLGIKVNDKSGTVAADLLLRTEGKQVAIERDGKVIWVSP